MLTNNDEFELKKAQVSFFRRRKAFLIGCCVQQVPAHGPEGNKFLTRCCCVDESSFRLFEITVVLGRVEDFITVIACGSSIQEFAQRDYLGPLCIDIVIKLARKHAVHLL